ncbi:MAG: SH3 domain-containing protein [Flammeovirgaceae bacterium]
MRRGYLNLFFLAFVVVLTACGGGNKEGDTTTTIDANGGDETEKVEEAEPTEVNAVCLWPSAISIHEAADPSSKYLTSVSLGEQITYLGEDKEIEDKNKKMRMYSKVRLADGTEGWTRKDFYGIDAKVAAVTGETTVYKRPDLLSKSNKTLNKMDVIAILSAKDDWLEIKGKIGGWFTEGWIKKNNITEDELDVVVAAFYSKAKMLKDEKQRKALQEILDNSDFSGSSFITDITEELSAEPIPEEDDMDEDDSSADTTATGGGE